MIVKIKEFVKSRGQDIFVLSCIILIGIISYHLGQVKALRKTPLQIGEGANIYRAGAGSQEQSDQTAAGLAKTKALDQRVVVSKNSSLKRYHYSWCAGAKQIKPENQIWFSTAASAQQAGYTLAGNCQ